jgi:glycosyltransferase involved in cell wall biosynthesis
VTNRKYRVTLLSSEYPPHVYGGLGTHVSEITAALAPDVEFDLFVPARGDYEQRDGIRVHEVPVTPAPDNVELWLHYCQAAVKVVEQLSVSVDLIHCHDWMTALAGVRLRAILRRPLIYNIHLPQSFASYQCLEKIGLINADLVLVNSAAVQAELEGYKLPIERIEIVPNGVDLETFQPGSDWPTDDGYMLFVGRLVAQKGVTFLLEALSVVLQRRPAARLIVVGDGELEFFLKRVTRYLGVPHRVTFLDWTTGPDLVSLYQRARFVVVPSYYEPFGIVALEAMACGRPVIASRTGGLAEIVNDGVNGFLVVVGNHLQLAQRMVSLLEDQERYESMGRAARKRAAEFSWQHAGARTLALYESMAARDVELWPLLPRYAIINELLSGLEPAARRLVMSILDSPP